MLDWEGKYEEPATSSVAEDLLSLYDEVTAFNDCCAFLCDAFASLAAAESGIDNSTAEGLRCLSHWMKTRMADIKIRLRKVREKAFSQTSNSRY